MLGSQFDLLCVPLVAIQIAWFQSLNLFGPHPLKLLRAIIAGLAALNAGYLNPAVSLEARLCLQRKGTARRIRDIELLSTSHQ